MQPDHADTRQRYAAFIRNHLAQRQRFLDKWDADLQDNIREFRAARISWAKLADALGMTRQAAWERFRHLDPPKGRRTNVGSR